MRNKVIIFITIAVLTLGVSIFIAQSALQNINMDAPTEQPRYTQETPNTPSQHEFEVSYVTEKIQGWVVMAGDAADTTFYAFVISQDKDALTIEDNEGVFIKKTVLKADKDVYKYYGEKVQLTITYPRVSEDSEKFRTGITEASITQIFY
jgi:hypothetical protein